VDRAATTRESDTLRFTKKEVGLTKTIVLAAAIAYGVAHDQITARVCLEYFTRDHPYQHSVWHLLPRLRHTAFAAQCNFISVRSPISDYTIHRIGRNLAYHRRAGNLFMAQSVALKSMNGGMLAMLRIAIFGGLLVVMGQQGRSEALFYYFRPEDQVPETPCCGSLNSTSVLPSYAKS